LHQHPGIGRAAADDIWRSGCPSRRLYRRVADFVDKDASGERADLAVEQPTKFDLIINLATAKALGLTIPPSLLAPADEIIE